jgi:hypothetical protein
LPERGVAKVQLYLRIVNGLAERWTQVFETISFAVKLFVEAHQSFVQLHAAYQSNALGGQGHFSFVIGLC